MGFRFRKSKNLGPFRVSVSKSGVSTSFGGKGARITKTASGRVRTTLSVPGTGISYVTESGGGRKQKAKAKEAKRARAAEAKSERQAAFAEAARNPAPAEAGLYRLLSVLTVVVGFALCFLFTPLGLVILACGIYVTVKARHIADKENRKLWEAPPPVAPEPEREEPSPGPGFSDSVSAQRFQITRTDEQVEMLRAGYKENSAHEIFPPDTVWASPRSEVYHFGDSCGSVILPDVVPIGEGEALRRGLRRCKKCDWHGAPVPAPGSSPEPVRTPVSKAKVEPVDSW